MAVVQISRIQVRRGQKNQGTGIPQLASGEIGWAVDSQELYIGNGSVSEGAPAVGNTKILTENENIFDFANDYEYKTDDPTITTGKDSNNPIQRTLQSKMDDFVNAEDFGVIPGTNCTRELQNALLQLFPSDIQNTSTAKRVTLYLKPGIYTLSSTIYIPSNTTICGAGKNNTKFESTADVAFQMINSYDVNNGGAQVSIDWAMSAAASAYTSVTGAGLTTTTASNRPRNIRLEGFTVKSLINDCTLVQCDAPLDCTLTNMGLHGIWAMNDPLYPTKAALVVTAENNTGTKHLSLIDVEFKNTNVGILSNYDAHNIHCNKCSFHTHSRGIIFGQTILNVEGSTNGPQNALIEHSNFENINLEAILVDKGSNNRSNENTFIACGNNGGSELNQAHPVIKFTTPNNESTQDWFSRTDSADDTITYQNIDYKPEVSGPGRHTQRRNIHKFLIENLSSVSKVDFIRLPADVDRTVIIDYDYNSQAETARRNGRMVLTYNSTDNSIYLEDDHNIVGASALDGVTALPKLRFFTRYDANINTAIITFQNQLDERVGATYEGANFNFKLTYVN